MPSLASALADAAVTGVLHLSFWGLSEVPTSVWALGPALRRLDLGHNRLTRLDDRIGELTRLEELWVNGNPLEALPAALEGCVALRHVDARHTHLTRLPPELSRLPSLVSLELAGTRVDASVLRAAASPGGALRVLAVLSRIDERECALRTLRARLCDDVFRGEGDTAGGRARLDALVHATDGAFTEAADLATLTRNAERLFTGADLASGTVHAVVERFAALRDENERKALGAELELALRAVYYDAAEPALVARVRAELIAALPSVADARFLVRHARALLPPAARDVRAHDVLAAMHALRLRQLADREDATAVLARALTVLYPDRDGRDVRALAADCSALLPRSDEVRALAADAGDGLFPPEFGAAHARRIVKAFRAAQAEKLAK